MKILHKLTSLKHYYHKHKILRYYEKLNDLRFNQWDFNSYHLYSYVDNMLCIRLHFILNLFFCNFKFEFV